MSLVKVSFTSGEQADHSMILFVFILNKVTASMFIPPFIPRSQIPAQGSLILSANVYLFNSFF